MISPSIDPPDGKPHAPGRAEVQLGLPQSLRRRSRYP